MFVSIVKIEVFTFIEIIEVKDASIGGQKFQEFSK